MNESQVMERSSTPHTSTTEAPPADPVPQVTVAKRDSKNDSSAKERKAGRKGLLSRKRLVLKIDPELTKESEGRAGQVASSSEGAGSDPDKSTLVGGGDATTPWWILEYRCPPPGHLGAHDVSVAVREQEQEQEEKQNERSSNVSDVKLLGTDAHGDGRKHGTGTLLEKQGYQGFPGSPLLDQQVEGQQKRDINVLRPSCDSPASVTTRSPAARTSPNQKRKIMHLHERDPSMLTSMVIAKEPKRFHEPSSSSKPLPPFLGAVTPTTLMRPLHKINIHSQELPASASAATASAANDTP